VQKACFSQAQHLPCHLPGYATCNGNDVAQDVREINALFGIDLGGADTDAAKAVSRQGLTR